ncbi:MAG: LTA synthase family protein [Bacteroidales bacterium]|jgi:phosphoglycerol transferase MdoB-like AlkP superfamily enzyme|nr:LTA synthase family protein [Bacteroidales bacterium]
MKQRILFFACYFAYWIAFFAVARLVFMLYHGGTSFLMSPGEWGAVFLHGAHMDASVSGYVSAVAALLLAATGFAGGKTASRILSAYTLAIMIVAGLTVVGDMELYRHWGFRMDATPLAYLKTPKEAFASVSFPRTVFLLTLCLAMTYALWAVYGRITRATLRKSGAAGFVAVPVFLFACALMILPVRGSLGVAPMNVGFVYHHPDNVFANHAAINAVWNVGKSLMETGKIPEYHFMETQDAEALFAGNYPASGNTRLLLKEERPNIVLIMLESFSNRMIEPLGGLPGVTPHLNRLCREGIVFSGMYAAGDRTDKGLLAVLSGYPAHPVMRVIGFPEKTRRLPFLSGDLKRAGYHAEHVSGFDNRFSNIVSYLNNAGYDRITDRDDFPAETYRNAKWGVPDHLVFEKLLERCDRSPQPFFKSVITLSSHEPFDVPMPTVIEGDDDESRFLNSACYTDRSLGAFIDAARLTEWWEHTLVVITADHGSRLPGKTEVFHPEKLHIPMIWTGGAVATADTVIAVIAGQTDIARTLLRQLKLDNPAYRFGKDILATPVEQFAFYDFNNGFGWVTDSAAIAFDNTSQTVIYREGAYTEEMIEKGKAYLQVFSADFRTRERQ